MASRDQKPSVPTRFPETTPPQAPSGDYSYTVELVGAIQNQLGKLSQAVETLTKESSEMRAKVDRLNHIAYAVGAVGTLLVVIFGFAANKIADAVIATMRSGH